MADVRLSLIRMGINRMSPQPFSRENLYALVLCLIMIMILILTSDQAPAWIYQGF